MSTHDTPHPAGRTNRRTARRRTTLAAAAGAVLAVTTVAAVSAAFAGTAAHRPAPERRADGEPPRSVAVTKPHQRHPRAPAPGAPVRVSSSDWRCEPPADEKFICSLGEASVVVTWRTAREHDEYLAIAKGGGTIFVSDVHGAYFATVMGGPDTTRAEVDAVGGSLVWR